MSFRAVRVGIAGLLLLGVLSLSYLLSYVDLIALTPFLKVQAVGALRGTTMSNVASSNVRPSEPGGDLEKIGKFVKNVMGYEAWPDQCAQQAALPQVMMLPRMDLMTSGPFEFLPSFRNPCWTDGRTKQLLCLPYFYLAGFPKCGTTDLYNRIVRHPQVVDARKEPHWLTRFRFIEEQTLDVYTQIYADWLITGSTEKTRNTTVVGDGSTSTVWENSWWKHLPGNEKCTQPRHVTADYLRHLNPKVKIIIMLRNPTDRMYSDFLYTDYNTPKSQEAFHRLVIKAIDDFNVCVKKENLRSCVSSSKEISDLLLYVGLYSVYLEDWFLRFPRDQILILRLEDMEGRVREVLRTVFNFLQLAVPDDHTMDKMTTMRRQNTRWRGNDIGPMWNTTRHLLDNFYRPTNKQLAVILQDNSLAWEDT